MRKIEFVSQLKHKSAPIGCGVAALLMLLKHHCAPGLVPSYNRLADELGVSKTPREKGFLGYLPDSGPGAWVDDAARWLANNKISFVSWQSDYWKREAKTPQSPALVNAVLKFLSLGPVMVGMVGGRWGKVGHWIVLEDFNRRDLQYLDPGYVRSRRRYLPKRDFLKHWDGTAVAIVDSYKT